MANIHLVKKEGESTSSLVYRFGKKVMRSGVLREAKKNRYNDRKINRGKRRVSALHREEKRKEVEKAKRMGTLKF
ncbi:MAG: 30S ribosomal protein S21 [Candidatus Colwellbacteria bacterium]|nr:30S ribosomal protein S21 [Candidatus Colwellbacteria bacterium]